jgi:hypothetical protein
VGFFDESRPPRHEPEEEPAPAPWFEAPQGWLGGVVAAQLLIARSDTAAVYLSRVVAYPSGCELTIDALTRGRRRGGYAFELMPDRWPGDDDDDEPPAELLRYGVEFADGRRATSMSGMDFGSTSFALDAGAGDQEAPDPERDIVLTLGGGGGGDRHSRQECWVWPLPPEGALALVCEWPAFEIPETRVELDAGLIRTAAERAQEIWPSSEPA